jgi:SPOR domain
VAVGSFAVAANADRAAARLKALNYSVARGRMEGGSAGLLTVFAGPFASSDHAARAAGELRGAGFPDATVIGR